jgi:hypothetical protein
MTWRRTSLSTTVRRELNKGESHSVGMGETEPIRVNICSHTRRHAILPIVSTMHPYFRLVDPQTMERPHVWKHYKIKRAGQR